MYPPVRPHARGVLEVGDGHRIAWEVSGNPRGKPVVVLHGGPGMGSLPVCRRHFDPETYRIVQFDQRGCGASTVPGCSSELAANTTWHLVSDMERLREYLEVERWQLFGWSWGTALALAYAQTHPRRVSELVLRGVFTARRRELDWLYRGGAGQLFPEEWERFLAPVPESEHDDPLAAYSKLVFGADPDTAERAALAWAGWEASICSLIPSPMARDEAADPDTAVRFARIAVHYFQHGAWLDEGQLIRDADTLAGIPGILVQGRYDAVCPPRTAYELHRAWPGSELVLLEGAGHSLWDPGILAELRDATDRFAAR
ncbi:prolyl aminopeptidase [Haloechinothrix sp. LS1_15]|uniref:prolyl aminopeptidase n=1 Tax=Haloechinothrix sp. LS1_15 TaxID=2652248 RepID=UPI002948745F|nr:prolyl aminopeptidase [Haloechinothrix sp. LS1_15]MDV6014748.1 prolyl aminopeptidase [Haloechinothrix sp. LS1_15]